MTDTAKKIRDVVTQLASEHRDLHGTVSKVGKAVDKNFFPDSASVVNEALFEDPSKIRLLNQVIVEHLLREGRLEIAEDLINEANLKNVNTANPFTELNAIVAALKEKDLYPALAWAEKHREQLQAHNSSLEFKLHRLQFIEHLVNRPEQQIELIHYARKKLQPLAERHEKEFQTLMGSLLYLKTGLQNSAYSHFLDPVNWGEICETFTRDACALLGLSVESPLSVTLNAGCIALPALLNIKQVMIQGRVGSVWNSKDELPVEIDLGRKCQFHSIFACPILKQQSSDVNPPMRLVCGHVISRDALQKLTNGAKVKCPYCPIEHNPNEARQIHF